MGRSLRHDTVRLDLLDGREISLDHTSSTSHDIKFRGEEVELNERYEDEIEEILGRLETSSKGTVSSGRIRALSDYLRVSVLAVYNLVNRRAGSFVVISICILLSAIIISAMVPGILGPLLLLGVILVLMTYFSVGSSLSNRPEKRWRGRHIEDDGWSQNRTWFQKLSKWLKSG